MIEIRIKGLEQAMQDLRELPRKLRVRALRLALAAGARVVRDAARQAAPVIGGADPAVRRGRRRVGTVRKAISVRTSKVAGRAGDVGVFVNVRPAKRGARGASSPADPFYWRWLEYGWNPAAGRNRNSAAARRQRRAVSRSGGAKRRPGVRFMEAGARRLQAALDAIMPRLQAAIAKLNQPKAPAP